MTDPLDRPLGLSLLTWLLWFWAGASFLVLVVIGIGQGPVPLNGTFVPREEALARFVPALAPMGLAAAGAALALVLNRPWARSAVLLPFALAMVAPVFSGVATSVGDLAIGALILVPLVVLVVWYLYFNAGAVRHFAMLRDRDGDAPPRGGTSSDTGRGPP